MRLCRFNVEETILIGFFADDRVVPIDQAADAFDEANGENLDLPATDDLLDLLPPDGPGFHETRRLADWLATLDSEALDALSIPLDEVQILVPIPHPPKLLLLAGNYAAHVAERGGTTAERDETFPYVFMKPPGTTLTNAGDPIVIPKVSPDHVDWECELGVVIGRTCRDVEDSDALEYVAGYTVVNDVSDRKFTPNPGRKPRERDKFFDWLHGKWHDTFCPMGPCLLSSEGVDPQALPLRLTVNGETKQDASTAQMVFPVAAIVSFLSRFVTLEPGDVISTGTPSGVGSSTGTYLKPGDVVRASIEGIGDLSNPVIAEN
ncbi:MAG: fumarylacetoacetate hydrolase family protein [Isosphaeraceae bacterium]